MLKVEPEDNGVQVFTDYHVAFITEHTLYPPASIKVTFPVSITLPPTGTEVDIRPEGENKDVIIPRVAVIEGGNAVKITNIFDGV